MAKPPMTENTGLAPTERKRGLTLAVAGLLLLTFFLFGDVLFSTDKVISNGKQDLVTMGIPWRTFGFGEVRNGNLPLWNPHVFLGEPFLAGFQSAIFYPPNLLYLLLPVGVATNWLIAGQVFLSGLFMCLWAGRRGLHPTACFVAGAMLMLCGPQFSKVYAGSSPTCCDGLVAAAVFDDRRIHRYTSQRLAATWHGRVGHRNSGGASAVCFLHRDRGWHLYVLLADSTNAPTADCAGADRHVGWWCALAAVQLLPGLAAAGESIRGAKLPFVVASSYSVPPENLITLAVPGFFGDDVHVQYWGRWNRWETSLTIGATGLILAIYGAIYGKRSVRRFSAPMALILLLIALGNTRRCSNSCTIRFRIRQTARRVAFHLPGSVVLKHAGRDWSRPTHSQPLEERRWPRELGPWQYCLELQPARSMCKRPRRSQPHGGSTWSHVSAPRRKCPFSPAAYTDPVSIGKFGQFATLGLTLASIVFALLAGCWPCCAAIKSPRSGLPPWRCWNFLPTRGQRETPFNSPRPIRPK